MKRLIQSLLFVGAFLLVLVACARNQPPAATPSPVPSPTEALAFDPQLVTWLKSKAIPFETTRPGSGFDDLQPLKKIIGNTRILAIGQDTHGTHEFQEMNARLVEFLVEEMGFNTWALEAPMPESFLVNDYVQTGSGDPKQLLSGLHFWIWNTQEVLDTIQWMSAHNKKPGASQVSFYGFDVPYSTVAMENVLDYLDKVDSAAQSQARSLYRCFLRDVPRQAGDSEVLPFTQACTDNLQKAYDNLLIRQASYERLSSPKEFALALQNARVILLIDAAYLPGSDESDRDRAMAENVNWILDQAGPNAKIVLSAHNFHVMSNNPPMPRSMGTILKEQYGEKMVAIGTSFYSGSVNEVVLPDKEPTVHPVPPPPADSYEMYFHSAGIPQFFLDLRDLEPGSAVANWMLGPHSFHWNPNLAFKNPNYEYSAHLPSEFDVMIHIDETAPSILLSK
jgi:erythromycin esterase